MQGKISKLPVNTLGNPDILSLLLSRGADPNISNNRATTPIHKAAQRGELECLQLLLKANANINYQDEEGITPLHRALNELGIVSEKKIAQKAEKIRSCVQLLIREVEMFTNEVFIFKESKNRLS